MATFSTEIGYAAQVRREIVIMVEATFRRESQRDEHCDPTTGRYITSDPIGHDGGLNTYAYAASNSLRYVDPYGLMKFDKLFGLPKDFWNWYHRNVKRRGDPDATKEEAEELFKEWEQLGKPKPDSKRNQRGFADPELLLWLIPWHIMPTELGAHPCELPGGPSCYDPPLPDMDPCE